MYKNILLALLMMVNIGVTTTATAQKEEIEQLILNVEKLAQFKQILADLKKGYQVVSFGYNNIKDLSMGNFSMHKAFLDGLMQVNPVVLKYKRVADIVNYQLSILKEYKIAYGRFRKDKNFTIEELNYLGRVYNNLFRESLKNLEELTTVITANKLRMSDDERLKAIDEIYNGMVNKISFLRQFNNKTTILALQRARERNDAATMRSIYGLNN